LTTFDALLTKKYYFLDYLIFKPMIRPFFLINLWLVVHTVGSAQATINWDEWNVPHIYAENEKDLFRAFGYAQMHSHGDLILRLYGVSRGRAAEYWGESYIESDILLQTLGFPDRSFEMLQQQPQNFKDNLEAFAEGVNQYVSENPEIIADSLQKLLPVMPEDLLAHYLYGMYALFIGGSELGKIQSWAPGSNAYAIGPNKTIGDETILLANPHLPWRDEFLFYEVHLNLPDLNLYGATLVGLPVLAIAFNEHLGWTHTVNTIDLVDTYQLTLTEDKKGYHWKGGSKLFTRNIRSIQYETPADGRKSKSFDVLSSVHGPIIAFGEKEALAIRLAGIQKNLGLYQWWQMGKATNLADFEMAIEEMEMPFFNILYADGDGNIFYHFNGPVPVRNQGDFAFWDRMLPGDSEEYLWQETHNYEDLPKILNPAAGWIQNANDPPWTSSIPIELFPKDYPPYLAPIEMGFRPQRSAKMLLESGNFLTLDRVRQLKMSSVSELANRLIPALNEVLEATSMGRAQQAMDYLNNWNRDFEPNSEGAFLFINWLDKYQQKCNESGSPIFAQEWSIEDPINTPSGLGSPNLAAKALDESAMDMVFKYRKLTLSYGEKYFLRLGDKKLPASGGPGKYGIFKTQNFVEEGESFNSFHGDSYISIAEFGEKVKALVLLTYGNSTQNNTLPKLDQLDLYLQGKMREVYFYKSDVESHIVNSMAIGD